MTGINSAVTSKFSDPSVIMTGITSRFISRPESDAPDVYKNANNSTKFQTHFKIVK
jgi:hypothetical protein